MMQINGRLSLLDALAIFQLCQLVNKRGVPSCVGGCASRGGLFCHHWVESLHVDITRVPMELSVTVIISGKAQMGMAKLNEQVTVICSNHALEAP